MSKRQPAPSPRRRERPTSKRMTPLLLTAVGAGLLALALLVGLLVVISQKSSSPEATPTPEATQVVETPVAHGATGKSIAQDQKDALAAATNLLNLAGKSPTGANAQTRLQTLEKEDYRVMAKGVDDLIRVNSSTTEALRVATYQSLITFHLLYTDGNSAVTLKPTVPTAYQEVYVDSQLGTAYVPLKVFSQDGSGNFSLEMVYVDKQWKLAPYTLIDSIRLSAYMVERQRGQATPSPKPSS